jgi:4a-hydroxytetrahydrobiopterin dehydratase
MEDGRIDEALAAIPDWTRDGISIRRQFTLGSFPDAIAFVTRLAFDAEAADHHPDIQINFKRVTLVYSTHSEGGLTQKDFDGARTANALADAMMRRSPK